MLGQIEENRGKLLEACFIRPEIKSRILRHSTKGHKTAQYFRVSGQDLRIFVNKGLEI